jgi:SAM-dependent methyltransferase
VDPNEGMLAVARRSDAPIEWHSGVAESLPFEDHSFDHTVSQFAAMFLADRAEAVREMARVTVAGGTVTVVTWAGLDRTPGYDAIVSLIADELGDAAAAALRAPFVLGDVEVVRQLFGPIGGAARFDELAGTARFASITDWVHIDVRGWTLAEMVDDDAEAALLARAEHDLAHFVQPDGSVAFPTPALVATVAVDR